MKRYKKAFLASLLAELSWGLLLRIPFSGDEPSYYLNSWALAHGFGRDVSSASRDHHLIGIIGQFPLHLVNTPVHTQVSWHSYLMSILIVPITFFSLKSIYCRVAMAILSSIGAAYFLKLIDKVTGGKTIGNILSWSAIFLLYPVSSFGPLLFPDYIAGAFLCGALLNYVEFRTSNKLKPLLFSIFWICLLPWAGIKFVVLMLPMLAFLLIEGITLGRRKFFQALTLVLGLAFIWISFETWFYSSIDFVKVSSGGNSIQPGNIWSPANLYIDGIGGWISSEGGLLFLAPITILSTIFVLPFLFYKWNKLVAWCAFSLTLYLSMVSYFGSPGFSFNYRYFMPAVPFLCLPLAYGFDRYKKRLSIYSISFILLSTMTIWISLTLTHNPGSMLQGLPNADTALIGYSKMFPQMGPIPPVENKTEVLANALPDTRLIQKKADGSVIVNSSDGAGIITFGPYIPLKPGKWKVVLDVDSDSINQLQAEVVGNEYQRLALSELPQGFKGRYSIIFVTTHRWPNIQVRIATNGRGGFTFHKMTFIPESISTKGVYSDANKVVGWSLLILVSSLLLSLGTLRSKRKEAINS